MFRSSIYTAILCLILLIPIGVNAQDNKRTIYDGGMMLHASYLSGNIPEIDHNASGLTSGIGGAIKFHITSHLRIGTEGYVSTMSYGEHGSTIKYGWGGLLADYRYTMGKYMPYVGVTVGGGARNSTIILEGNKQDWEKEDLVYVQKTGFMAIAPFVGCDYIITPSFHLTFKMDYLNALTPKGTLSPSGPRLYFGFLMYH